MAVQNSYYLYQKYEKRGDQSWTPVYPEVLSIDANGTMPLVLKMQDDPSCVQTETKFSLILNDSSTVSAECNGSGVITSGEVSSQYSGTVVSAELGNCVTSIDSNTFGNCSVLTSVTIPNSVASIGSSAFTSCENITGVTIPNSVRNIDNYAFNGCVGITGAAFGTGLTSIGEYVFYNCSGLTNVSLPNSVASIGSGAFNGCTSLININFGPSVTNISEYVFYGCKNLATINIHNTVNSIGNFAFRNCCSLTSLTIPSSVASIGRMAFRGCSGLTSVTIERTTPPELGSNAFENTNNCAIYVPCNSVSAYQSATNWSTYASRIQAIPDTCQSPKYTLTLNDSSIVTGKCNSTSSITQSEISDAYKNSLITARLSDCVTSIGNKAFYRCTSLTSVNIPYTTTSIGSSSFTECYHLSSITIPDSVKNIGDEAFKYCDGLSDVTIGSGVTSIGYGAFDGCDGLRYVVCLPTTPPVLYAGIGLNNCPVIYVPVSSMNLYKQANVWSMYASRIQGIV